MSKEPIQLFKVLVLCLECTHQYIGLIESETKIDKCMCPECHQQRSFVSFIPDEFSEESVGRAEKISTKISRKH